VGDDYYVLLNVPHRTCQSSEDPRRGGLLTSRPAIPPSGSGTRTEIRRSNCLYSQLTITNK
jgi:hypothetical protein